MGVLSSAVKLSSLVVLTILSGCAATAAPVTPTHGPLYFVKTIAKGIAQPVRYGGGSSGLDQNDLLALERARQVVDVSDPVVAAALANPTACDPTDADGNPDDDQCPATPTTPAP